MLMKNSFLFCLVLPLLLCATSLMAADRRSEVETVLREYERAYNAHDAKALADVYTEDGVFLPPDTPVKGRATLAEYWKTHMGDGLVLKLSEFELGEKVGWAAGTWSLNGAGGGNFVITLRREKSRWLIAVDTYNSASPK